jgi:hypothetical protein
MAIIKTDDIDELFSEMKKESLVKYAAQNIKPKYIELESSKRALRNVIIQTISTSQLEYDEQRRTYFVCCKPLQPFVNDVIRYWEAGAVRPLKLGLVSATTDKVAIMHVSGIEVIKQPATMANVVSIDFILDKEHNTNDINSTGIRMKMHVLVDEFEIGNPFAFEKKRKDTIKVMDASAGWSDWGDMITTANGDFRATTKSIVTKQYEDAVASRIKEIKNQKKAEDENVMPYKAALDMITELTKTDSSSGKVDADGMISKFLSVIKKIDF